MRDYLEKLINLEINVPQREDMHERSELLKPSRDDEHRLVALGALRDVF